MQQPNLIEKVHRMNLRYRLLLLIPGLMLAAFPVFIFAKGDITKLFHENWQADLFFFFGTGIALYCSVATRLVTSSKGIRNYFLPPLYFTVSWTDLKYIYGNPRGSVYLFFSAKDDASAFQKLNRNAIQLSAFVDDWVNNELIAEIKKYAPQFKFPNHLITQPKLKIWHRTSIILLYYTVSFVLSIPLIALAGVFHSNSVGFLLILAVYGFMGGVFGGMLSLSVYPSWIANVNMKSKFTKKTERIILSNYLLPFSGWMIVFFIGLTAYFLGWRYSGDSSSGTFDLISFYVGAFQLFFLPYMKPSRNN